MAGEARYRLAPLTLPDPDDLTDAARAEAVALFVDRARSADAHFTLDGETIPAVAKIVARLDGMPLAIELATARVEALGVIQLLDRLDDRFALLTTGQRLAADRQRSLAATVEWSYQLLSEQERQVFRAVSVFPDPFTLEAAEAVAGTDAGPSVLHLLVDCSLLVPPRAGPDCRIRYGMLETLRAYGTQLLAQAGEQDPAASALARYALAVAGQAGAGLAASTAEEEEVAAARWLDAEDATMRQVLAWALEHDPGVALRLGVALPAWWLLRGRLAGQYQLLREVANEADAGSDGWCIAQFWLGYTALYSADLTGALGHFTAVRDAGGDRPPSRALADCLSRRSRALSELGRAAEAVDDGRRSLAISRELGYPAGEALALVNLGIAALYADYGGGAVQLVRQAEQIRAVIPGWIARACSAVVTLVLIEAGDLAGRRRARLRGGAGRVPGRRRPEQPGEPAGVYGDPGPAGGPHRGCQGTPQRGTAHRIADRRSLGPAGSPGLVRAAVRHDRALRRGRHGLVRIHRAASAREDHGCACWRAPPSRIPARSRADAGGLGGPRGRGTRRGDEPGHRG